MIRYYIYILIVLFCVFKSSYQTTYKICATEKTALSHTCQLLQKGNSQVECVRVIDSVDCAIKLVSGDADFGVFTAEEGLVASKFINNDVAIIGQVKHRSKINDSFAFQSVTIVRKNFTGDFTELRGKKYCHPGFNTNQFWTDRVLKEFETKVVPRACTSWLPQARVEMLSLADFFGDSCRPGTWAPEQHFDEKLKKDYSELCKLCDNPHPTMCAYNAQDSGSHREALDCLTQKDADVTYVALNYVQEYFGLGEYKKRESHKATGFPADYKFLCPNQTVQDLDTEEPCGWIKQPWNLVVARKTNDIARTLRDLLPQWLPEIQFRREGVSWQHVLNGIIQKNDKDSIFVPSPAPASSLMSLVDVIKKGRDIPSDKLTDPCRRPISWCTTSNTEQSKCQWLQYAVLTHGIRPDLKCVQAESKESCLSLIMENKVDIVGIDTDLGYTARLPPYNTSTIMYQDTTYNGNYRILAVIKDGLGEPLVKDFKSIKGRKACFPNYKSLAWVSFLNITKSFKILPKKCSYSKAVGELLSSACVPGLKTLNTISGQPDNLCYSCKADECSDDTAVLNGGYKGDYGALLCLSAGGGDIAFVNYKNLLNPDGELIMDKAYANSFRVLCKNGSLSQTKGFDVDDECVLSTGIGGEIVAKKSFRWNRDISTLLLKIDDWFGAFATNFEGVLHVYEKFQNTRDLLFQSSTVSLITLEDQNYDYVNSYKDLLNLEPCSGCSTMFSSCYLLLLCLGTLICNKLV